MGAVGRVAATCTVPSNTDTLVNLPENNQMQHLRMPLLKTCVQQHITSSNQRLQQLNLQQHDRRNLD